MIMSCHGLRPALTLGRAELVPPRKSPSALPPGFSPQGHPSLDIPPSGGAGSARPQTALWLHPDTSPLGLGAFAQTSRVMRFPGMNTTLERGRAERVPPRKSPPRDLQALRAGASVLRTPRRGGTGPARPRGRHRASPNVTPFWPRAHRRLVRNHDLPRFALYPYLRTRRARPSEKIALPVVSPAFPARPYHLGLATQPNELWPILARVPSRHQPRPLANLRTVRASCSRTGLVAWIIGGRWGIGVFLLTGSTYSGELEAC